MAVLGQTGGRTAAVVHAWLDASDWKAAVQVVAMYPCATYRRAVQDALPQAGIVANHFHVVGPADGHPGPPARHPGPPASAPPPHSDPTWTNRCRQLRCPEGLSERSFTRMRNELVAADASGELLAARIAEELRALLATPARRAAL